jgi:hypothetical protein
MIQVSIIKKGELTNQGHFDSLEVAHGWLSTHEAMGSFGEDYEVSIEDISSKITQDKTNKEALDYLSSTDWMIIRELDCGIVCPADIKIARQAARERIIK